MSKFLYANPDPCTTHILSIFFHDKSCTIGSFGGLELTPLGKSIAKKAEKADKAEKAGLVGNKKRKHLAVDNAPNTTAVMGKGFNQLFFQPKAPMGAKKASASG